MKYIVLGAVVLVYIIIFMTVTHVNQSVARQPTMLNKGETYYANETENSEYREYSEISSK